MPCEQCVKLDVPWLITTFNDYTSFHVRHHPDYASLANAVENGCVLCRLFHHSIISETAAFYAIGEDDAIAMHREGDAQGADGYIVDCSEHGFGYQRRKPRVRRYDSWGGGMTGQIWERAEVSIRLCSSTGRTANIPGRMVSAEHEYGLYKQWILECASSHEACPVLQDRRMPTRLLDVRIGDGDRNLKLVETLGGNGQYVTLSHCWGQSNPPVTTTRNYSEYLACIEFARIPRTFQDAVTVTRGLNFRYLWIDCFCIVQDDKRDWERESAAMQAVFENAALTIAGPEASDSYSGFLRPRLAPPSSKIEYATNGAAGPDVIVAFMGDQSVINWAGGPRGEDDGSVVPLRSRAWTVQERYLAPRSLYVGPAQNYFECATTESCEAYWRPRGLAGFARSSVQFGSSYKEDLEAWYHLVYIYNTRNLTYEDDKLPALSGLASKFQQIHGDTYLAGLWRGDLLNGLQWYKVNSKSTNLAAIREPDNLDLNCVPTWSWAHRKGLVRFLHTEIDESPAAEIIDVRVEYTGESRLGGIKGGRLRLKGRLKQIFARMSPGNEQWGKEPVEITAFNTPEDLRHVAMLWPDEALPEPAQIYRDGISLWCLLMAHVLPDHRLDKYRDPHTILGIRPDGPAFTYRSIWGSEQYFWVALALRPVEGLTNTYRRVGIVLSQDYTRSRHESIPTSDMKAWFDDCEIQSVDIV